MSEIVECLTNLAEKAIVLPAADVGDGSDRKAGFLFPEAGNELIFCSHLPGTDIAFMLQNFENGSKVLQDI